MSSSELKCHSICAEPQPSVARDASIEDQPPTPSGIELEERLDRRAKEVQEMLSMGQATLEKEQSSCDAQHPLSPGSVCGVQRLEDDGSRSPTKRRRCASESWKLLFEYADDVSKQLQTIDVEYWSKSSGNASRVSTLTTNNLSSLRYDVPNELLFVADAAMPPALAHTKQKLSTACKRRTEVGRKEQKQMAAATTAAESEPTRKFWPEVSKLKKDMSTLREKLREAKRERSRMRETLRELHGDLNKMETPIS